MRQGGGPAQAAQACLPHLRLGQLIVNAIQGRRLTDEETVRAIFYKTDEELVRAVENYAFNRDQL